MNPQENLYAILVFSILGMIISLTYIILFCFMSRLHKSPGDIYLGMSIGEGLLCLHQLFIVIPLLVSYTPNEVFCGIMLICITLSVVLLYSYSILLFVHMVIRLQFALQAKKVKKWEGHVYSWTVALIYCFYNIGQNKKDGDGYCGTVVSSYTPFTFLLFIVCYIIISFSTLLYLQKEIRKDSKLQKDAKKFIEFLKLYMTIQLSFSLIIQICLTIVYIAQFMHVIDKQSVLVEFCIILSQYSVLMLPIVFPLCRLKDTFLNKKLYAFLNKFKKYNEKKKKFQQSDNLLTTNHGQELPNREQRNNSYNKQERFHFLRSKSITNINQQQIPEINSIYIKPSKLILNTSFKLQNNLERSISITERIEEFPDLWDLTDRRRSSSISNKPKSHTVLHRRRNSDDSFKMPKEITPFLHVLTNHVRSMVMKRILCLLIIQEKDKLAQSLEQQLSGFKRFVKKGKDQNFQDTYIYIQSAGQMNKMFHGVFNSQDKDEKSQHNKYFNMISHAQSIFELIIQQDVESMNLMFSLDLIQNESLIQKCSQTSGGKSGEFFFFTHDNKFLLKTISPYEMTILKKMLKNYFWHMKQNPNSFIAKIVGVFTFEGFETGSISLVMMKNVTKCASIGIERIYDLKGSSYDREVMKPIEMKKKSSILGYLFSGILENNNMTDQNLKDVSQVLKDKDFLNLEIQLNIDPQDIEFLLSQIRDDTIFLKQQGLMDYSLIIFKINWFKIFQAETPEIKDQQILLAMIMKRNSQMQHCYRSTTEQGIYYHIGIIDYLQTYNTSKIFEKFAKKVIKFDAKLDTSSQHPNKYQIRFMNFIQQIV